MDGPPNPLYGFDGGKPLSRSLERPDDRFAAAPGEANRGGLPPSATWPRSFATSLRHP